MRSVWLNELTWQDVDEYLKTEDTIINYINNKIMETSLIEVLKSQNLEISNVPIRLLYTKPAKC